MSEKFKIHLKIAGKEYGLNVERAAEEVYRRAERDVNGLVAKYKSGFKGEQQDYLAMAALALAVENVRKDMSRTLGDDMDALAQIDKKLDAYLNEL